MKYLLTLLCSFALTFSAAQTTFEVQMLIQEGENGNEFYFEPVGLLVQPGDTVRFVGVTPHHNVVAYHPQQAKTQRVPDGVPPFSSPLVPVGNTWEYTFNVGGTYDIWCAPHELWGMAMRVVVGEPGGPAEEPITDFGPGGVFGVASAILSDAALASDNIVSAGSVSWADLNPESKTQPVPSDEVVERFLETYGPKTPEGETHEPGSHGE